MNRVTLTAILCLLVFVSTGAYYRIVACAPAPPAGYNVRILDEFALIIWDRDTKLEHFIRVANFETDAPEMGFLVPTPSVPELFEVNSDRIAQLLHAQTAPRTVNSYQTVKKFGLGPWPNRDSPTVGAAPRNPVEVIGQYDVAGYEATVLRADDPAALKDWLDEHNYATTDSITDWLQVYTDQNWIITAFKLSKTGDAITMKTKAVRMSFRSDQPFYPYREPTQDDTASSRNHRLLRIFLLADQRYDGTIGTKQPWPAYTAWSDNVSDSLLKSLARDPQRGVAVVSGADAGGIAGVVSGSDRQSEETGDVGID